MINSLKLDNILRQDKIFSFKKKIKEEIFTSYFNKLTKFHYNKNSIYKKILISLNYEPNKISKINKLPFLPVTLFKNLSLKSVNDKQISKVMYSSGTTGTNRSKIFLDKVNSINQMKALNKLFFNMVGSKERLPILIIDTKSILNKKNIFSARAAAILGFSIFAKNITYALNEEMSVNNNIVDDFMKKYGNVRNIVFGMTSIIWEKFLIGNNFVSKNCNFSNSILLHGGGWKKLQIKKISNIKFKKNIKKKYFFKEVINYYGMIEQTGTIFFECSDCGNFVTSIFSDIIIRDKYLNDIGKNKKGLVQLLSVLPTSYPGHNILTEDIGIINGEDDCPCGRMGKRFKIFGRLEKSEIRGCSDAIS